MRRRPRIRVCIPRESECDLQGAEPTRSKRRSGDDEEFRATNRKHRNGNRRAQSPQAAPARQGDLLRLPGAVAASADLREEHGPATACSDPTARTSDAQTRKRFRSPAIQASRTSDRRPRETRTARCAPCGSRRARTALAGVCGRGKRRLAGSHGGRDHEASASSARRSSGRVNIATPSSARGHSSRGRSRYSSMPFPSGSRR